MDAQNDLSDFDYELPPTLIAQKPVSKRTDSRLMVVDGDVEQDWFFRDFIKLIEPTDVLVVNDTKVVKARLHGLKDTGGAVEILVERIDEPTIAYCLVRASKPLRVGRLVHIDDQNLEVLGRGDELAELSNLTMSSAIKRSIAGCLGPSQRRPPAYTLMTHSWRLFVRGVPKSFL